MIDALLIYNLMFYTRFFFFLNDFLCVKEINNKERKMEGKFKMYTGMNYTNIIRHTAT